FLARPSPPQRSATNLRTLVDEVLLAHKAAASHARVEVVADILADAVAVIDARRISQVVRNLLLNAFQAMPKGGQLFINTVQQASPSRICFLYRDTVSGFSAAALEHHHELCFSEREGGMSIGLTVCSEILRAHGGALRV